MMLLKELRVLLLYEWQFQPLSIKNGVSTGQNAC
jgi:hypothetical protein